MIEEDLGQKKLLNRTSYRFVHVILWKIQSLYEVILL